jgi:hypothetical protein
MKIVATLVIRDGADMLGPILAHHHAEGVAAFLIVDHASVDLTPMIAATSPWVVHLERDKRPGHLQAERVTRLARLACDHDPDWIIHLDCDEFWTGLDALAGVDPAIDIIIVEQIHMHLMTPDSPQRPFRPGDMSEYIAGERITFHKVAHRPHPGIAIADGNHKAVLEGSRQAEAPAALAIHHYSIRDYASFDRKIAAGGAAIAALDAAGDDGRHSFRWREWARLRKLGQLRDCYDAMLGDNAARLAAAAIEGRARRWP